ncbi:MAG: hypothetical protein ACRDD1_13010, partial [Planctomycetia bacterium]
DRSVEGRYTAVRIFGPERHEAADETVSGGGLRALWTQQQELNFRQSGPGAPAGAVGWCGRRWQVADPEKRRLANQLPEATLVPSYRAFDFLPVFVTTRFPTLFVKWSDTEWRPIAGVRFDYRNGVVEAPYAIHRGGAEQSPGGGPPDDPAPGGAYEPPSDARLVFAYLAEPFSVRRPTAGFTGTAHSAAGIAVEMQRYDEALAVGWEYGRPAATEHRLAQFGELAERLLQVHKDVVYTGGCTILGIDYEFLRLNRRVNFAAVDGDGAPRATGWVSIGAILTDVVYDYTERLTTLQFSSDHAEFTQSNPEKLKRQLKIRAMRQFQRNGHAITADGGELSVRNWSQFVYGEA